jgi:thiol-disulfide isomerase/thioredoxin
MSRKINYMALTLLLAAAIGATIKSTANHKNEEGLIKFPSLSGATGWLNTPPLASASLRGKVVVVEFWTYTCINWRRTLPYVRAWAERYKDQGLVVIGVSTPEFSFEKDVDNVRRAAKDMKIDYPIATDNNYEIWNAFSNQYWPALYLIDAKGHIRHHQFGEGNYDQSEKVIQQLLAEAGAKDIPAGLSPVEPGGAELAADLNTLGSGETYLGYGHAGNFASPGGGVADQHRVYSLPVRLKLNQWALSGNWTIGEEAVVLNQAGGRMVYRFHARDVNLIMGPVKPGASVHFRVLIDGQAPGTASGIDIDGQGYGTVTQQGMFQLIRQPGPITDREFSIEFSDAGVEAFDLTFG